MKIAILATALSCCCLASYAGNETVRIKGQLVDMGRKAAMNYNGASSMLGDSRDIMLNVSPEGKFDTTFVLKEPTYFSISRNTLYLTPGDDLTVKITQSNNEAEFSGKGAEVNTYMKKRLFPKGGSFLEAGKYIRKDFAATKVTIDSLAAIRYAELDKLTASDEFKSLEKARITADVINSYISYGSYSRMFAGIKDEAEYKVKWGEFAKTLAPLVNPLYKEIIDEKMLNVAVVRDVLSYATESDLAAWFEGITLPERTKELYACDEKVSELRREASPKVVNDVNNFLKSVKNKDFSNELYAKIAQVGKLLPGQTAPDLVLQDVNGVTKKMSDFKGKVIYVDLWATWCGPCIQESPAFEALGKKYANENIVFLPVSTDNTTKIWLSYLKAHQKELTQYYSQDKALKADWAIFYIPRFILIDKDFKIVDAYAPRPSSDEISALIDATLKK